MLSEISLPTGRRVEFYALVKDANNIHYAIEDIDAGKPIEDVFAESLPAYLKPQCQCQRGLRNIDRELRKPTGAQDEAKLIEGLQDVNRANPKLGKELKRQLADSAEKKGQPKLAKSLRNLTLVPEPTPPEKLEIIDVLPLPEGPPVGQAGQREAPFEGLDELGEDVPSAEKVSFQARTQERKLKWELERWSGAQSAWMFHKLQTYAEQKKEEPRPSLPPRGTPNRGEFVKKIRTGLHRELRPSEKLLIADMFAGNYTPEQVVAELRDSDEEGRR
jgi:hypothetical protein